MNKPPSRSQSLGASLGDVLKNAGLKASEAPVPKSQEKFKKPADKRSENKTERKPMSMHYLVYDIESVVDKKLLNRVLYAHDGLSDEEAYKKHVAKILEETKSNFVNAAFHIPVCLAAVAVDEKFEIQKIGLLGEQKHTPEAIAGHFWDLYNGNSFVLVDFNGRGYDIRLMELWAYRLGLQIHRKHWDKFGPRYRYSEEKQLDLHESITNTLSIRYQGGLNMFAKMLGKPGKMETKGEMVQELHEQGKIWEIEDYCLGDALDTYFVFLRWMLVRSQITPERERELEKKAHEAIVAYNKESGYMKKYLENFKFFTEMSL